jgi:hypothetical protein
MFDEISKTIGIDLVVTDKIFSETKLMPQYICRDEYGKEYIVVISVGKSMQHFLTNSINGFRILEPTYGTYYKFNKFLYSGYVEKHDINFVVYKYFQRTKHPGIMDVRPLQIAKKAYFDKSKKVKITKETVDYIANRAIEHIYAPNQYAFVQSTIYFEHYKKALANYDEIKVMNIHTDYNRFNIMIYGKEYYLIDFETYAESQVASYDWYHLLRMQYALNSRSSVGIPYYDCCEALWNLYRLRDIGNLPLPEFNINKDTITMQLDKKNYSFSFYLKKGHITVNLNNAIISPNFINKMGVKLLSVYKNFNITLDNSVCMFSGAKLKNNKRPLYSGQFIPPRRLMLIRVKKFILKCILGLTRQ